MVNALVPLHARRSPRAVLIDGVLSIKLAVPIITLEDLT